MPPPSPVAIAIITTPNRSNFLKPAFSTPDADENITATIVIQYRLDNSKGVGSSNIEGFIFCFSLEPIYAFTRYPIIASL